MGITVFDFMVAGGVILFIIAILDVMGMRHAKEEDEQNFGVVPLGTPMVAGPALITTAILLVNQFGAVVTLISVFLNLLLTGILFMNAHHLTRWLGPMGSTAMSKISSLLLASIAVMMIRKGVLSM